jgi:large subunit ribosomal protein L3
VAKKETISCSSHPYPKSSKRVFPAKTDVLLSFGFCLPLCMKYIIGRKVEMKQQYADNGSVVPLTIIQAGPCVVSQVKTVEKDGYNAIQLGFGEKKKASKPVAGHVRGLSLKEGRGFACVKEMRLNTPVADGARGDRVDVTSFSPGDVVDVTGTSKGRGFAGVVKRHHFHGHPTTHGHKDQERMPGSIGSGGVQHVFKGKRMAGRMGGEQVTVKKLSVVSVDPEHNTIAIHGAIPGARNGLVVIVAREGDMKFLKNSPEEPKDGVQDGVKETEQAHSPVHETEDQQNESASGDAEHIEITEVSKEETEEKPAEKQPEEQKETETV